MSNQPQQQVIYVKSKPNTGLAALLSFIIPGAGQMYRGHVIRGLIWFACVVIGYFAFIVPGVVLHLACILFAAID